VMVTRPPDQRNSVGSTFAATWPTSHDPGRVAEKAFTAREYTPYPYHAVPTALRTSGPVTSTTTQVGGARARLVCPERLGCEVTSPTS
jgi:hypothetical protein